ncbi:hypothetical protein [Bacillus mycoides]|uniref:hypothetical protein n=1 Tax=Bacillus mycoides TaxID=1405 RepID=UPI000B4AE103|nr:hypothetical protein [Bacillus mycoides]
MKKLNEMVVKSMKDIERRTKVHEKMVELKNEIEAKRNSADKHSQAERYDLLAKYELLTSLQDDKITNIKVKETMIKIYEIEKHFEATYKNEGYSTCWEPIYGRFEVESYTGNTLYEQHIYVRGEELFLNDEMEKYDSIESAFEKIRINLHDAEKARQERLKEPCTKTLEEILG